MKNRYLSKSYRLKEIFRVKKSDIYKAVEAMALASVRDEQKLIYITNCKSKEIQLELEKALKSLPIELETVVVGKERDGLEALPGDHLVCKAVNPNCLVSNETLLLGKTSFLYIKNDELIMSFNNPAIGQNIESTINTLKELEG